MTRDRAFFSKCGVYKQEMLNSLCNLLEQNKIPYNTLELVGYSRKEISRLIKKYRNSNTRGKLDNKWHKIKCEDITVN